MRVTTDLQPAERFQQWSNRQIHRKHTGTGSHSKNLSGNDNRIEGAWNLSVRSIHDLTSQRIFLLWWSSNQETTNSNQRESNRLKQKSLKKKRSDNRDKRKMLNQNHLYDWSSQTQTHVSNRINRHQSSLNHRTSKPRKESRLQRGRTEMPVKRNRDNPGESRRQHQRDITRRQKPAKRSWGSHRHPETKASRSPAEEKARTPKTKSGQLNRSRRTKRMISLTLKQSLTSQNFIFFVDKRGRKTRENSLSRKGERLTSPPLDFGSENHQYINWKLFKNKTNILY